MVPPLIVGQKFSFETQKIFRKMDLNSFEGVWRLLDEFEEREDQSRSEQFAALDLEISKTIKRSTSMSVKSGKKKSNALHVHLIVGGQQHKLAFEEELIKIPMDVSDLFFQNFANFMFGKKKKKKFSQFNMIIGLIKSLDSF